MHPISIALCEVYKHLIQNEGVNFRLYKENQDKLDTIVKIVHGNYFGFRRFPTDKDQAAAYFYFIIKNHPVTDGNKRLAVLWLEIFTDILKIEIKMPKNVGLDKLAVAVEKSDIPHKILIPLLKRIMFES